MTKQTLLLDMTDKLYNNIVDKKYAEALVNIAFIKRELEEV